MTIRPISLAGHNNAFCLAKLMLVSCFVLGLSIPFSSAANSPINKKIQCVTSEFAPYVYFEDGKLTGIEVELLALLSNKMEVQFTLSVLPWSRALSDVKHGNTDCLLAAFKSDQREVYLDYSNVPVHISQVILYKHQADPFQFGALSDLHGKTITIVRDFKLPDPVAELLKNNKLRLVEVSEIQQSFEMLNRRRADLLLYSKVIGGFAVQQLTENRIEATSKPISSMPAYIAFSKKKQLKSIIPALDNALTQVLQSQEFEAIQQAYLDRLELSN